MGHPRGITFRTGPPPRPQNLGFIGALIGGIASIFGAKSQESAVKAQAKAITSQAQAEVEKARIAAEAPVDYVNALTSAQNLYWQEELDRMAYRSSALTNVMNDMKTTQARSASATSATATTGIAAAGIVAVSLIGVAIFAMRRKR